MPVPTRTHRFILSLVNWNQAGTSHPVYRRLLLTPPSYLCLYYPSFICSSGFPANILCTFFSLCVLYVLPMLCDTVILTYLITHSMVQSPSWAADWFAASQEIPRISRNPKVHYRTHKRTPPVPNLGQPNPVHIPTSHLLEIHPNIIHPSTPRSPQWPLSLRFPHQEPIHPSLLTHTRHIPSPSHSSWFCHPHNIWWGVILIKLYEE